MQQVNLFDQGNPGPLKTYPGRKGAAGTWQKIISEIPKCELFIEAMAGSGLISSIVTGCHKIVNDVDGSVIERISYTAADVEFKNLDYRELIKRFDNGSPGRVFYFDPPYLISTRSYRLPIYKHDWTRPDHYKFLEHMKAMKCPTMISHYPCKLYNAKLKNWRQITYNTMTRAGARAETLYMNFPPPVLLQCYKHTGENFTDRQRIKRKVQRLISKLDKENQRERAVILSSITDNYSYVIS